MCVTMDDTNKSKSEQEAAFADRDRLLFGLTESDAQTMAEHFVGRTLTDEEMQRVKYGLNAGLDWWREIMKAAITEAVKKHVAFVEEDMGYWLSEDHLRSMMMTTKGRFPTEKEIQSCAEFANRLYYSKILHETRTLSRWHDYWKEYLNIGDFLTWVGKNLDALGDREVKEP